MWLCLYKQLELPYGLGGSCAQVLVGWLGLWAWNCGSLVSVRLWDSAAT